MARKGVLVSNPDVKNMTKAQWMFEFHALQKKEKTYFDSYFEVMRKLLVNILGLNLLRPESKNGGPKNPEEMTDEEKDSYLPLSAWVGHPEILKKVAGQLTGQLDEMAATSVDQSYEDLVAKMDEVVESGGDMEPIINPTNIIIPKNPRYEQQFKQMGVKVVDSATIDADENI